MVLVSSISFSQTTDFDLTATVNRKYQGFSKGETLRIKGLEKQITISKNISCDGTELSDTHYFLVLDDGKKVPISISIDKALKFEIKSADDLWNAVILQDVIPSMLRFGPQSGLRRDLESEALGYINYVQSHGMEFNDPYLLDYLYALVNKIAPSTLIDNRPGSVNILIEKSPDLNAFTFPNGTIVITTGLLSILHSEDELVAVMAHEIAHFVLDHQVQNINEMTRNQKRAEALANFATFMASIVEVGVAVHSNGYYIPGAITSATATIATSVTKQTLCKMGMEYNHVQENEADKYAMKALRYLGYDTNALATALNRMVVVMQKERMDHYYFASYTHPSLMERIHKAGTPSNVIDANFEKMMSFAVTNTAYLKYDNRRYREVLAYTSQNIYNNVGTADDYLLKANCLLALYDETETNTEALSLINRAKQLEPDNINLYKAEILAQLRLKNKNAASTLLTNYINYMDVLRKELPNIMNERKWLYLSDYIDEEEYWAEKMKIKLAGM